MKILGQILGWTLLIFVIAPYAIVVGIINRIVWEIRRVIKKQEEV